MLNSLIDIVEILELSYIYVTEHTRIDVLGAT